MDVLLDCYFEQEFKNVERSALQLRYKRKELVDYLHTLIQGCSAGGETTGQEACREAILAILRFHDTQKRANGNICHLGKFHNILYVAMKLVYDWSLNDTGVIATLLDELYACERTFERIFVGAAYGQNAPFFIVGWRSDFGDRHDNLNALAYFLEHATNASLEYAASAHAPKTRFVDVPTNSFAGYTSALNMAVHAQVPDLLLTLLRYGAIFETFDRAQCQRGGGRIRAIDHLLGKLLDAQADDTGALCVRIILRAVACVDLRSPDVLRGLGKVGNSGGGFEFEGQSAQMTAWLDGVKWLSVDGTDGLQCSRDELYRFYKPLIDRNILPARRCGLEPAELKHLARCRIRTALWRNYQLPVGIEFLSVPNDLKAYINLLVD